MYVLRLKTLGRRVGVTIEEISVQAYSDVANNGQVVPFLQLCQRLPFYFSLLKALFC